MKGALALALAALGGLAMASVAAAQTLPMPELPPEAPVLPPAGAAPGAVAPAPSRPPFWEYDFGFGAGWDSNIDFYVPDGPSGTALTPRGNLARVFWNPHGELKIGGGGAWVGYSDQKDLNRYYASATLEGHYQSSPHTTLRVDGSYGWGYSDESRVLTEQGVLLPLVKSRTLTGGVGLTQQLGVNSSLRLDGRIYRTEFDQADKDALGLVDGQSLRGTAGLERRLGPQNAVGLEYALEGVLRSDGNSYYLTHYGSLQWTHLFSPRSGILFEGGASYTPDAAEVTLDRQEAFFGGVTVHRQVKRSTLTLYYRREVVPVFGAGVSRIDNRAGLSATVPMGRSWRLELSGYHTEPQNPKDAPPLYARSDDARATLACRLGRYFEISGEGRYRRRDSSTLGPAIESYQAGLYLSLASQR